MKKHPYHNALRRAVERAGNNQSKFARDVGTSQQMVSYWLANGKPLPGELVLSAEAAGYGSRHDLRPDLYPIEQATAAWAQIGRKRADRKNLHKGDVLSLT